MSKSRLSELTRGAGMAADLWLRLENDLEEFDGVGDELAYLVTDDGAAHRRKMIESLIRAVAVQRNCYRLTRRYASLEEAIEVGGYTADRHVTAENFNIKGEIVVDGAFEIYQQPNRWITSKAVVRKFEQRSRRPATLPELCAFGEKFPDVLRQLGRITALGSTFVGPQHGTRGVVSLDDRLSQRHLTLIDWNHEWSSFDHFLGAYVWHPRQSDSQD